jgi:hypothetical protein
MSRSARLAGDRFRCDQTDSTGLSSEAYAGELELCQPVPRRASSRIAWLTCVLRLSQTRTSGPPSCGCGIQQPGVVRLGEPLALVPAAERALVHPVEQPGPLARLHRDQRGQRHSLVAAAGHRDHRVRPRRPRYALSAALALAGLVLEDQPGARAATVLL